MTKILRIGSCESCPYAHPEGPPTKRDRLYCDQTRLLIRTSSEARKPIPDWCPLEYASVIDAQRDAAIAACAKLIEAANCDDGEWDDLLAEATNMAQAVVDAAPTPCDETPRHTPLL